MTIYLDSISLMILVGSLLLLLVAAFEVGCAAGRRRFENGLRGNLRKRIRWKKDWSKKGRL